LAAPRAQLSRPLPARGFFAKTNQGGAFTVTEEALEWYRQSRALTAHVR
jgi:hypothetical protein